MPPAGYRRLSSTFLFRKTNVQLLNEWGSNFQTYLGRKMVKFGGIIVRTIENLWEKSSQEREKKWEKKDISASKKTSVSPISCVARPLQCRESVCSKEFSFLFTPSSQTEFHMTWSLRLNIIPWVRLIEWLFPYSKLYHLLCCLP